MFESMKEHPDLLFHDAAVKLVEVQQSIDDYLGNDLIAMLHRTDDRICNKANKNILLLNQIAFILLILFLIFN